MVHLELKRTHRGRTTTLSELHLNGQFFCYGLEHLERPKKIKWKTAIPAGRYPIRLNLVGSMNSSYRKQFPKEHIGMLEVTGIPDYSYVYIHIGNYSTDTAGCILVGDYHMYQQGDYAVFQSKVTYQRLYKILADALSRNEEVIIDVTST